MRSTSVKGAPGLYCDMRLGGIERWFSGPPEDAMARVPREIVKSDETNLSLEVLAKYVNWIVKRRPETYLLGLIRGHWNLEMPSKVSNLSKSKKKSKSKSDKEEIDRFNVGIAAVTPSWDIHYLLHGVELMRQREEILKEIRKKNAPTLDSD